MLQLFARGRVHLHYREPNEAEAALHASGFTTARLYLPTEFADIEIPARDREHVVRVIEAAR